MRIERGIAVLVTLGAAVFAGCGSDPLEIPELSTAARRHLENVVDVMEANSVNRRQIDWTAFRTTVRAAAGDIKDYQDAFEGIYAALGLLGDNHSSYAGPPGTSVTIRNSQVSCSAPTVVVPEVPNDIGYVRVTTFVGSGAQATTYARNLQTVVSQADAPTLSGWIVDLRGNSGGNMWPMIAGVGPILGERVLGHFIDPDGAESKWEYRGGAAILDSRVVAAVAPWYTLLSPEPRVAVLTDGRVASSGEAVAIAFKARANTRFFGTPTCGLSTANRTFTVDNATLVLTVSRIADRTKTVYGDTLPPDEVIPNSADLLTRAIDWIRQGGAQGLTEGGSATRSERLMWEQARSMAIPMRSGVTQAR